MVDEAGGDYLERPGLERARQLVRSGQIDCLVCLDPDRFARNLLGQLLVTDEIDRQGVALLFVQHNRERTAEGNLFYALRGAIAEFEKAKILERTQRGKRGKARQGLLPSYCNPYGYRMDTAHDRLQVDAAEARWVRQLFAWAARPEGGRPLNVAAIARQLNALGVPAPRGARWHRSTVAAILANPLYTGTLHWGRFDHTGLYQARRSGRGGRPRPRPPEQWIALPVEPLISPALFAAVQRELAAGRRSPRRGEGHLLTGLAWCGRCGAPIHSKRAGRRYLVCARRYPSRAGPAPCRLPHLEAERVEAFVWRTALAWGPTGTAPALVPDQPLPDLLQAELADALRGRDRLLAALAGAQLDPGVAAAHLGAFADRITRLQAALEAPTPTALPPEPVPAPEPDPADQRAILRRRVSRVLLSGPAEDDWRVEPL